MKMTKKGEWLEILIPEKWENKSIEAILVQVWKTPRNLLHQLRMEKGVNKNGEAVSWKTCLATGDRLQIHLFKDEEYGVQPEYIEIEPIFEDDHLLIVNKPAGMDTHPNQPDQIGTLANAVAFHWQLQGICAKVRHIHRLDRDTTGGVIFAKHPLSASIMDRMLEERTIKRTYIAFVQGLIASIKGTIHKPIGRDRHHPTRRRVSSQGQDAITHYRVLERYSRQQMSLLELQLETGRTHQIRVHMSYEGHPLIGDLLYGGSLRFMDRQALHAERIELPHPLSEVPMHIEIPWPDDLLMLKSTLT